jgi:hypothetical protein
MGRVNILMDMSMYDMFLLCPERFKNRYKLHKELPQKAKPLDRGTLIHVGQEFYYEGVKAGKKFEDRVAESLMKMKEAYVISSDIPKEEFNFLLDTMEENWDHWRFQDESLVIHEVEKSFIKVIYEDEEIRIALSGKIDLFVSDNKDEFYPIDHKSMERNRETLRLSNQFRCYCYATGSKYLLVNKVGLQKSLKPHEKFLRVPITYDDLMLEQWKDNVILNIMHYLECEATGKWPMNETSCDKFNRKCEYYEVCESSGMEAKQFKILNNYITVDPWDVTKILAKSSAILEKQ